MRNWWTRFGCFLTGYNYAIVRTSSEVASKAVLRYAAAMTIICILWAFVGYTFTQRYLSGSQLGCIAGAMVAVVTIIQIERQIILSVTRSKGLFIFRACLALLMALIGAVIIDQIILKKDIELEKISYVSKRVDSLMPTKTKELKAQILALDASIKEKEHERQLLIEDVGRMPLIKTVSTSTQSVPLTTTRKDTSGNVISKTSLKPTTSVIVTNTPNPKQALIAPLDSVIAQMRTQLVSKDALLLNVRPDLEKQVGEKIGFLDELKVMHSLISTSGVALCFWLLWFLFLLFIEMLVLFSKMGDKDNDYEKTILHQMQVRIKRLDLLAQMGEKTI